MRALQIQSGRLAGKNVPSWERWVFFSLVLGPVFVAGQSPFFLVFILSLVAFTSTPALLGGGRVDVVSQ